jgi:outer membrane lipoprotein SlyB
MRKLLSLSVCAFAMAGLAGCAPAHTPASAAQATGGRPIATSTGTILSMRVVMPQSSPAPWRAGFLAASGASGATVQGSKDQLVEFIVRSEDGSVLSVVQTNVPGFHVGDRVIILRDDQTRLVRPA